MPPSLCKLNFASKSIMHSNVDFIMRGVIIVG